MRQPDYKMVQGGNYQLRMSPEVAGKQGQGLARLGRTLEGAGVEAAGILGKIQQANEDKQMVDLQEEWDNAYSKHQQAMLTVNPLEHQGEWEKVSSKLAQGFNNTEMSRNMRDRVGATFQQWNGRATRNIGQAASQAVFSDTRRSYEVRMQSQQGQQDWDGMVATATEAEAKGYLTPSRLEEVQAKAKTGKLDDNIELSMRVDPFQTEKDLEGKKWPLSPIQRQRYKDQNKRAIDHKRREIGESIVNQVVAGDIAKPEDIDKLGDKLQPKTIAKLKNFLADFNDGKKREFYASQEQQDILVGEMRQAISGYNPNGEAYDNEYIKLITKFNMLNDSPLKKELLKQINGIRTDKETEIKNFKDWGRDQVTNQGKRNLKGIAEPEEVKKTLQYHINKGFFNEENLSVYFDESDKADKGKIKKILEAKEKINGKQIVTIGAQMAMAKKLFQGHNVTKGTEWDQRMARALQSGGLNTVISSNIDPEEQAAYEAQIKQMHQLNGQAEREFNDFLKTKPNEQQVEKFLIDQGYNVESRAASPILKARPVYGETSYNTTPRAGQHGNYKVIAATRDQIRGFKSIPGNRIISTDFNDADNKSATGIEVKVPSNATAAEIGYTKEFAKQAQAFFAKHGVDVPIRRDGGVKRGGRGVSGVFHVEPFFLAHKEAKRVMEEHPEEYAKLLGATMGKISGATFIAPHKKKDTGAGNLAFNERDFAMHSIIPNL